MTKLVPIIQDTPANQPAVEGSDAAVEAATVVALAPDQEAVVAAVRAKRAELGMTDRDFFDHVLAPVCGAGAYWTWRRFDKRTYTGRHPERWIRMFQQAMLSIVAMQVKRHRGPKTEPTSDFRLIQTGEAVLNTIALARERTDEMRVVILKAKFGFGKSAICREIQRRYPNEAIIVRARQSWQRAYMPGPRAICSALGRDDNWPTVESCERAMYAELRKAPHIVCIDDANTLAPDHCNMVRDIIEECPEVVVFLALLPAFFEKLNYQAYWEASQMVSRALCVIPAEEITPRDVAAFMEDVHFNGAGKDAHKMIARAANDYAGFRMVKRVRELLLDKYTAEQEVPLESVINAVATAEQMFAAYPMEEKP